MIKRLVKVISLLVLIGLVALVIHFFVATNFWVVFTLGVMVMIIISPRIPDSYIPALLVLDLSTVYALQYFNRNLCSGLINIDFDSQNFFTWVYTAIKGYLPYRDTSYAYGLLIYHNTHNIFVHFLYIMQIPLLAVGMWCFINRIFKRDKWIKYLTYFLFSLYLMVHTGPVSFTRYGLSFIVLMLACIGFSQTRLKLGWLFFYGCLSAAMVSLVTDQGIYFVVVMFALITYRNGLMIGKVNFRLVILSKWFIATSIYGLGIAVGLLPFVLYLLINDSLSGFMEFIHQLGYMNIYIKNSFTSSLERPANLWIFMSLAISYAALTFKLLYKPSKLSSYISYCQVAGVLVLSMFLQKNLLRTGMENQITFIGVFLWIVLLAEYLTERTKTLNLFRLFAIGISMVFVFFLTTPTLPASPINTGVLLALYHQPMNRAEVSECKKKIIDPNRMVINTRYLQAYEAIKEIKAQPTLFSFPGDPIFYILNQQKPAPYFNLYDASTLQAQLANIAYIEKSRVDYVIYNTNTKAIQDNVLDVVRGNAEIRYLITHFTPLKQLHQFVILQRNDLFDKPPQFFSKINVDKYPEFYNQLLNFGLGYIPRSEGRAKWPILSGSGVETIIQGKDVEEFNNQLKNIQKDTSEMILLITPEGENGVTSSLTLNTDGPTSTITFLSGKKGKVCLIHLNTIPALNLNNRLESIYFSEPFSGKLQLVKVDDVEGILW